MVPGFVRAFLYACKNGNGPWACRRVEKKLRFPAALRAEGTRRAAGNQVNAPYPSTSLRWSYAKAMQAQGPTFYNQISKDITS